MVKSSRLTVSARILPDGQIFTVFGRDAWALLELHNAGVSGCTQGVNDALDLARRAGLLEGGGE